MGYGFFFFLGYLTPWVSIWAYFGGFVIWLWMGMVCGVYLFDGFFAVDQWWLMVGGYEFYGLVLVLVYDLILGLFLFVILVVGVKVVGGGVWL